MTDTWELYHQTGPDGQEWGIKIRPGYIVTGFAREDAEAVVAWQNASCRPASDILERAKAAISGGPIEITSHDEIIRQLITEVERLRSDLEHMEIDCSAWRRSSERKDARIKELEAVLADMSRRAERLLVTVTEDEARRNRLEAAFLEAQYYMKFTEEEAREALERIRSGKDVP